MKKRRCLSCARHEEEGRCLSCARREEGVGESAPRSHLVGLAVGVGAWRDDREGLTLDVLELFRQPQNHVHDVPRGVVADDLSDAHHGGGGGGLGGEGVEGWVDLVARGVGVEVLQEVLAGNGGKGGLLGLDGLVVLVPRMKGLEGGAAGEAGGEVTRALELGVDLGVEQRERVGRRRDS